MTFKIGSVVTINKAPNSRLRHLEPFNLGDVGVIEEIVAKRLIRVKKDGIIGVYFKEELLPYTSYIPTQEGDKDDDI